MSCLVFPYASSSRLSMYESVCVCVHTHGLCASSSSASSRHTTPFRRDWICRYDSLVACSYLQMSQKHNHTHSMAFGLIPQSHSLAPTLSATLSLRLTCRQSVDLRLLFPTTTLTGCALSSSRKPLRTDRNECWQATQVPYVHQRTPLLHGPADLQQPHRKSSNAALHDNTTPPLLYAEAKS